MERRRFLAAAGAIAVGAPILGDPGPPLTIRDVITSPPQRIGLSDVRAFEATVTRLGVLDREHGGMAARDGLVATAKAGETMLNADATEDVRRAIRHVVAEAHRLAG